MIRFASYSAVNIINIGGFPAISLLSVYVIVAPCTCGTLEVKFVVKLKMEFTLGMHVRESENRIKS